LPQVLAEAGRLERASEGRLYYGPNRGCIGVSA
jgi:hypothetical protein